MYQNVATNDPVAVKGAVQTAHLEMFPEGDRYFIPQIFGWTVDCFTGHYDNYQSIDAQYHDLEHTLQGALCMARLLHNRHFTNIQPVISERLFQLGMSAILLHDTGYLKKTEDTEGTGSKYTVVHVRRSADFAAELLRKKNYSTADIKAVQNMILCTGINAPLDKIPFQNEAEKITGFALGTADLLGQMAADDYVDKLPILFAEFAEATEYENKKSTAVAMFASVEDLRQKTPAFWEKYVKLKLSRDFDNLYRFLNNPYPSGPNYYIQSIEANIERLRSELSSDLRTAS